MGEHIEIGALPELPGGGTDHPQEVREAESGDHSHDPGDEEDDLDNVHPGDGDEAAGRGVNEDDAGRDGQALDRGGAEESAQEGAGRDHLRGGKDGHVPDDQDAGQGSRGFPVCAFHQVGGSNRPTP